MGSGRSDSVLSRSAYTTYAKSSASHTIEKVFKQRTTHPSLNPNGVTFRESCDSVDNPRSTPIIAALDITGSMGIYAHKIAAGGLTKLVESIYDKSPVSDPHIMFMAVGDPICDESPLQVSQFEADNRIIEQLSNIYVEGGGGGNGTEGYNLPWYFAAFHTKTDCITKRNEKGYLFTMGDEGWPLTLKNQQLTSLMGDTAVLSENNGGYSSGNLLSKAREGFYVYHILIGQGHGCRFSPSTVYNEWYTHMDNCVLYLSDADYLAELIVTTININEGMDVEEAINIWEDPNIAACIRNALKPSF